MQLELFNCPVPQKIESVVLPQRSTFLDYIPNFEHMQSVAADLAQYRNVLVIGHGGSITSFYGIYGALREHTTKHAYFLSTIDPDYIHELRATLRTHDTLVVVISKSGENTTLIEAMLQFLEYPLLFITQAGSPLEAIAQKLKVQVVAHPPIGGRYTGLTEVALLPALLCGLDVTALFEGARELHQKYEQDNESWRAASVFWQLEQGGFVDVFLPVYSHRVFPLGNLIVQLAHESFGKEGKGQTYLVHEAPESQHHTNQRFFGGRKNIAGFAISVTQSEHDLTTHIPAGLHSVSYKDQSLIALNKISLNNALHFELEGVMEDARLKSIPMAHLQLTDSSAHEIGRLIAFWQLYAIYSSVLRQVDPFTQPQVEDSKRISFAKRLQHRGVL